MHCKQCEARGFILQWDNSSWLVWTQFTDVRAGDYLAKCGKHSVDKKQCYEEGNAS